MLIGIRFALRAGNEELKSLVQKAHLICSTEDLLKIELHDIQVFRERHDFPLWVIKQTFVEEEQKSKHLNIQ